MMSSSKGLGFRVTNLKTENKLNGYGFCTRTSYQAVTCAMTFSFRISEYAETDKRGGNPMMRGKLNRSNKYIRTRALGLILLFLLIVYGKGFGLGIFSMQANGVAGGSTALAMSPNPELAETESPRKKTDVKGRQKSNAVKNSKYSKPYKRRMLMSRFSPTAIFSDGLPTPENPLNPRGRDLAQSLNGNRVSKPLNLYSRLLYAGIRLQSLDGKRFEADGEVFRGQGVPQGHFLLYRWFFDCCALDAQPFGVIVHSDELSEVQKSFWVHVAGTMRFRLHEGKKIAYIEAETVHRIPAPPPEKRYITY